MTPLVAGAVGAATGYLFATKGKTARRKANPAARKRKSSTASTGGAGKKANGTLKKGYRYAKGGRVVKAKKA